jgi:hypothetical protein
MKDLKRPLPEGYETVTYKNHFELRYLRWDYLVRSPNPKDEDLMGEKDKIARYCARKAFKKYAYEFSFMGMEIEDIENIARVYTVSYLGKYSSTSNKEVRDRHIDKLRKKDLSKEPTAKDIEKKDNRTLISFLDQRLGECSMVFKQKCRGQAGFGYSSLFVRKKGDQWPEDSELFDNPGQYGWEKVGWSAYLKMRNKIGPIIPGSVVEVDGKIYRVVSSNTGFVGSVEDFQNVLEDSTDNPEQKLINLEESGAFVYERNGQKILYTREDRIKELVLLFKQRTPKKQEKILKKLLARMKRLGTYETDVVENVEAMLRSLQKRRFRKK